MAATADLAFEHLDDDEREAVRTLLFRLADDEYVVAERYTEWQVRAPTLESDIALANIAQDELGHARLWYDLLEDFGSEERELVWERSPEAWHHATLAELPYEEGSWADAVLRSYLYDVAEDLRLAAVEGSTYTRLRDRVETVENEEDYHLEHAQNWLERLVDADAGHDRVQAALDRLFPYALTLFAPADPEVEARIGELGLRDRTLSELRRDWLDRVVPYLESLGLDVPDPGDTDLPTAVGRDGEHTDHWNDLHEEFTRTYRELDRQGTVRIMPDPDDT
ncbi:phenylacetate-CoA oxygenase subunit PaaI [Halobacteriales archaeon SW_7_71_33]|nr:MAG: phenylacetate-CoA oxygenase subunit PaaI [Halobacteriales archaeon SW_7_71_33]